MSNAKQKTVAFVLVIVGLIITAYANSLAPSLFFGDRHPFGLFGVVIGLWLTISGALTLIYFVFRKPNR